MGLRETLRDRIRRRIMKERPLQLGAGQLDRLVDKEESRVGELLARLWEEMRDAEQNDADRP